MATLTKRLHTRWAFQDREHSRYLDIEVDDVIEIAEKIDI